MNFVREKVSKKKKRFKEDGFDLDLTYITPRIIAMGFPSSDVEGLYRNPIGEVYKFYETRHKDRYKLYNLCAEREYDPARFHGRVARYPFEDHNAPPIQLIVDCCKDIHQWLSEDENNVVGINCKAGKGRTGLIICCYLMHSGVVQNSEDAMLYYGTRRTKDGKGVTIASQRRYVRYYEQVLKKYGGEAPPPKLLKMTKLKVYTVPNFSGKPFVIILIKGREVCVTKAVEVSKKDESFEIEIDYPVFEDVKVQLCARKSKKKHQKMCHFWFSTAFVPDNNILTLEKFEIDVANKDKKCAHFKENFKIEAFFEPIDEPKKSPKKSRKSDKKSKNSSKSSEKGSSEDSESKKDSNKVTNDEKSGENFKTKRKRAQSFYDIEEDEELSDSEKDEREMERYFEEEDDEEAEESIKLKVSSNQKSKKDEKESSNSSDENEEENKVEDKKKSESESEEEEKVEEKKKTESESEEEEKVEEKKKTESESEEEDKVENKTDVEEEEEPILTEEVSSKSKSSKKDKKEKVKDKKKDKESKQKKKADKKASKKNLK